ncbi:MAG: hypothetical protein MRY74_07555 [Neomegalonema sp.]|nr:hypothetical protein [Neomegalonema sp.]
MLTDGDAPNTPPPANSNTHKLQSRSADLAIWIASARQETELRRKLCEIGVLQQHSVTTLQKVNGNTGLWRCGFAYVGRQPDRDSHLLAMLRRIGVVAQWLRVERLDAAAAKAATA